MKSTHSNRCGPMWIGCIILTLVSWPEASKAEDFSSDFHLLASSFSAGGMPATDGEIILTSCSIGGLGAAMFQDTSMSIQAGDVIPLTEAGLPFLEFVRDGDGLRLTWNATDCVLQEAGSLFPAATWTNVTAGRSGYFLAPSKIGQRYFRLRRQIQDAGQF